MLDEGQDSARHEACGAHGGATSGDLGNLDDPSAGRDLDATPVTRRFDLVDSNLAPGVDDDLNPITSHAFTLTEASHPRSPHSLEGGHDAGVVHPLLLQPDRRPQLVVAQRPVGCRFVGREPLEDRA